MTTSEERPPRAPHREQPLMSVEHADAVLAELRADAETPRGGHGNPQVSAVSHPTAPVDPMTTWPDTTAQPPPVRDPLASARWLLGRHPDLARLAALIPGVVTVEADSLDLDLNALAQALTDHDAWARAWAAYETAHRPPDDPAGYWAWRDAGPPATPAVAVLSVLDELERTRLRLLACWSFAGARAPLAIPDLEELDTAGRRLLADWLLAVTAVYPS